MSDPGKSTPTECNQPLVKYAKELLHNSKQLFAHSTRKRNWLELIGWQNSFAARAYIALPIAALIISSDVLSPLRWISSDSLWRVEMMYFGALFFLIGQVIILSQKPPTLTNETDPLLLTKRIESLQSVERFKEAVRLLGDSLETIKNHNSKEVAQLDAIKTARLVQLEGTQALENLILKTTAPNPETVDAAKKAFSQDIELALGELRSSSASFEKLGEGWSPDLSAQIGALVFEHQHKVDTSEWRANWLEVETTRRRLDSYSREKSRGWATGFSLVGLALLFLPALISIIVAAIETIKRWMSVFTG